MKIINKHHYFFYHRYRYNADSPPQKYASNFIFQIFVSYFRVLKKKKVFLKK